MIWKGYKRVSLKSIVCDAADIRRRTKAAHVAELADDIRKRGEEPIQAPTIRAQGSRLLCGRDRMAALVTLKVKKLWVHVVQCDDTEAKELELAENIYRRADNRSELLAQLVALKEQQYRADDERTAAEGGTVSRAPRDLPKAKARRDVAQSAGITPSAVRKAEQRAKDSGGAPAEAVSSERHGAQGDPATGSPSPHETPADDSTVDLLGCDDATARAVAKFARKDQEAIDDADKYLRLAQAALARMTPGTVAQELRADVHRVADRVRAARPESVCPWCKGLPKTTVAACAPCGGAGYVPSEKRDRAPTELREGPPLVAIDGTFYPYAEVRDGKLPAKNGKPAKPAKTISVVMVDGAGNETPAALDDGEQAY